MKLKLNGKKPPASKTTHKTAKKPVGDASAERSITLPTQRKTRPAGLEQKETDTTMPLGGLTLMGFLLMLLLLGSVAGLIAWAIIGQIEESVPGMGQLVPEGDFRKVMAAKSGMVSELRVRENEPVQQGQLLMVLEPDTNTLQQETLSRELRQLQEESSAIQSALSGIRQEGLSISQQTWLDSKEAARRSQLLQIGKEIEASASLVQESREQLSAAMAMAKAKEQDYQRSRRLFEDEALTRQELNTTEEAWIEAKGRVKSLRQQVAARHAEWLRAQEKPATLVNEYKEELALRLTRHQQRLTEVTGQLKQNMYVNTKQEIRSPVDGVIQELSVHGKGEGVSAGTALFSMVPNNMPLLAEVKVANRELSFIRPGQWVRLKLDALPYQQFGTLDGQIESMSPSTHTDRGEGRQTSAPYYILRVRPKTQVMVDERGKKAALKAGMTFTAMIQTRKKPIISFFTESMHERFEQAFSDPTTR